MPRLPRRDIIRSLLLLSLSPFTVGWAETNTSAMSPQYKWAPHTGRILGYGTVTNDIRTIGGDGMLPVYGSQDGFAFADFMGDYGSDNTYLLSPGGGYRQIIHNQIVGGYFFGDNEKTSLGQNFWVLSPGIEWMTAHWDAHVNGYFPTETSKQSGPAEFASNLGNNDFVEFETGTHNQIDELIAPFDIIGNGVDVEMGYSFAEVGGLRSRVYVGGYYYQPPSSDDVDNIMGITAGFEQPLSKNLSLSLFNSYDNVNNYVVGISLTATFGQDSTVFSNNIQDRLLDPIQRHVGIINTGAGTYDQQDYQEVGRSLQYDNVYFLEPDPESDAPLLLTSSSSSSSNSSGTSDIATYGNPAYLNQTTLDAINAQSPSGARIYLEGGSNANYYVNNNTAGQSSNPNNDYGLVLYSNQDLYGRNSDYTEPAASNEQPQILVDGASNYNGFIINGSENTLSDLTITSDTSYINGTTTTMATGVIAYNESSTGNQTITIINTNITGLVDGVYAQNDSQTGTMTINATNSTFNNNGGDMGIDGVAITGYKNYGASGFIAVNSNNDTNGLIINATDSEFNNNGTLSGGNSYISNNNFSVASGMSAINNSHNGALLINTTGSAFNNNGTLSGGSCSIYASEANNDGISNNIAAATGILALNNSNRTGSLTINANTSTFNNNGTLSGDNSSILAGGSRVGDNVNAAAAAGIFAFNNNIDNASGSLTITAVNSEFNGNGTLNASGRSSSISAESDNRDIASVPTATAAATGIFAFNNSVSTSGSTNSTGSINMDIHDSQFNNNGTLSTANASISATTTNRSGLNEVVAAGATGIFAVDGGNIFSNYGSININANNSTFNNNGTLSGDNTSIQAQDTSGDYGSGSIAATSATGIFGFNNVGGNVDITATNSQFNNNAGLSGTGSVIQSMGAYITTQAASGVFVLNNSGTAGNLSIESLSGSSFNDNGVGTTGYGIYGVGLSGTGTTTITYTGATFSGSPQFNTNQGDGDWTITWIN